jgi:hypothetical protein
MSGHKANYRTTDGSADYRFSFEERWNGRWRIYIDQQPSYRGRADDAHSTHRLSDGRQYVCWTKSIRSLEDAKRVAAIWADKTQRYIRTGSDF